MLLIQANKGQKSKLVSLEFAPEWSALTKVHGETKRFLTLVTLSPSRGVYVICVKSVERTENCTWPLSCVTFI